MIFLKQIFRAIGKEIINCLYSVTDLCKPICKARGGSALTVQTSPPKSKFIDSHYHMTIGPDLEKGMEEEKEEKKKLKPGGGWEGG